MNSPLDSRWSPHRLTPAQWDEEQSRKRKAEKHSGWGPWLRLPSSERLAGHLHPWVPSEERTRLGMTVCPARHQLTLSMCHKSLLPGSHRKPSVSEAKKPPPPPFPSLSKTSRSLLLSQFFCGQGPSLGGFVFNFHLPDLFSHKIQKRGEMKTYEIQASICFVKLL